MRGGEADHAINTGGFVRDNNPAYPNATDPGYLYLGFSTPVAPGMTATIPHTLYDTPAVWTMLRPGEKGPLAVTEDFQFMEYLVFRPTGGIWVKIAEAGTFTISGDAAWNGGDGFWEINHVSPEQETIANGNEVLGFVEWSGYLRSFF